MISLGNTYSSTVLVPVRYVNFPQNKVMLNHVPNKLAVSLNGSGYDLLGYDDRLTQDTLIINLDNLKMSLYGEYERGYLDPSLLSQELQKRIDGAVGINRVLSDSIEFLFDLKVSRTISIRPVVSYDVKPGYVLLDSIYSEPGEVEVFGPLTILDTLSFIKTLPIVAGVLEKSKVYIAKLDLERLGEDAQVIPDSVELNVLVDQLTEKRFMIEPHLLNVPDSLTMLTFPNATEIVVQIPLSRFDDVTKEDFDLSIDFDKRQEDYPILPVDINRWSNLAEHVQIRPKQVEIVLSERE
jgi:hypothetical protein